MAQKVKVKVTVQTDDGKKTSFDTKTLTALFNKLPAGTHLKLYMQENQFAEQFVGDYVTKSPSGETPPPEPTPTPTPDPTPTPTPDPTPTPVPPTGDLLWSSEIHGKWNDGNKRTLTTKEGGQKPDDKSIFCAASGSPELIIDGDGVAHLHAGSGGVDNLSIRLRSRHQGECNNQTLNPAQRFGGHGWAIDSKGAVDFKTEDFHNQHSNPHNFNSGVSVGTAWHHIKQTCIGNKTTFTIDNKKVGEVTVIDKGDTSLIPKNSYIWFRINNAAHGRIYIMAINVDSTLEFDFQFEPVKSSIALKNVTLIKA